MKILRLGAAGKNILIGEDSKNAVWYAISDNVKPYLKNFKEGDLVSIRAEKSNGKDLLLFISKPKKEIEPKPVISNETLPPEPGSPIVTHSASTETKKPPYSQDKTVTHAKPLSEQHTIKAQAIGHMTSRALISLQGQVNTENIYDLIDTIYNKFTEKVNGYEGNS